MNRTIAWVLLACCFSASAASFDCGKAKSATEKLICSDAGLSALDEKLNAAYKGALNRTGDQAALRQSQRNWLSSFDVSGCSRVDCLKEAFTSRVQILADLAPAGKAGSAWTGEYERVLRGKADRQTARLSLGALNEGRIHISGTALWLGPYAGQGQVNTGEIDDDAALQPGGDALVLDAGGCKAHLQLRNDRIVVTDETGCGGAHVTFDGEYRRIKPR